MPAFFSRDGEKSGNRAVRIIYIPAGIVTSYQPIQSRELPLHQVDRLKNLHICMTRIRCFMRIAGSVFMTHTIRSVSMLSPHTRWMKRYFLATGIYHSISTTLPVHLMLLRLTPKSETLRNYPIFSYAPLKGVTICYAFTSPQHNTVAASRHTYAPIPGLMRWW